MFEVPALHGPHLDDNTTRNPLNLPKLRKIFMGSPAVIPFPPVSATEIAFIADIGDKDVNRLVDEHIVPDQLFRTERNRQFARICAVLARFFYTTADILTKDMRKFVIASIHEQIGRLDAATAQACVALTVPKSRVPRIRVCRSVVTVDFADLVSDVRQRAELADKANKLIVRNPEVLRGEPVFKDTRVPVDAVLDSLDGGDTLAALQNDWAFLDAALVDAARTYRTLHPRRGRPRRLIDVIPDARLISRTVVASHIKRR
ncbi:MAG TPA: DUF433 domain-containing protein [Bordetella sp.]|jgi:uncharacterized protein (DUF433 family)|nr:DUF433 domain-containing protein [Bordetella sp.]